MKKAIPGFFVLLFFCLQGFSQLLLWSPQFIQESNTPVVITVDLSYYDLQRSIDGQNFSTISQVTANGSSQYYYNNNLATSSSPVYYYRLKSVDKDGNFKYSDIIKIKVLKNANLQK